MLRSCLLYTLQKQSGQRKNVFKFLRCILATRRFWIHQSSTDFVTGLLNSPQAVHKHVGRITCVCKYVLGQMGGIFCTSLHEACNKRTDSNVWPRCRRQYSQRLLRNQTSGVYSSSPKRATTYSKYISTANNIL